MRDMAVHIFPTADAEPELFIESPRAALGAEKKLFCPQISSLFNHALYKKGAQSGSPQRLFHSDSAKMPAVIASLYQPACGHRGAVLINYEMPAALIRFVKLKLRRISLFINKYMCPNGIPLRTGRTGGTPDN